MGARPSAAMRPCLAFMASPAARVDVGVWRVVCLAAVEAMAFGRRVMWRRRLEEPRLPCGQRLITDFFDRVHGAAPAHEQVAAGHAALRFWELLGDFVGVGVVPDGWDGVEPDHPFLGVAAGRMRLNLPSGVGADTAGGSDRVLPLATSPDPASSSPGASADTG